jgi:hypothetical protein
MPYAKGAVIALRNDSPVPITHLRIAIDAVKLYPLPSNLGRFHAA